MVFFLMNFSYWDPVLGYVWEPGKRIWLFLFSPLLDEIVILLKPIAKCQVTTVGTEFHLPTSAAPLSSVLSVIESCFLMHGYIEAHPSAPLK